MMNRIYQLLVVMVLVSQAACATHDVARSAHSQHRQDQNRVGDSDNTATNTAKPLTDPSTSAMLYNLLVGEVALKRKLTTIAAEHYIVAAEQSRDIDVVRRATQVALFSQDYRAAERSAQLWLRLQPDQVEPRQVLSAIYVQQGNREAAREHLMALVTLRELNSSKQYLTLARYFATEDNQKAALTVLEEIASARPDDGEAHFAAAAMALRLNEQQLALHYAARATELKPEWPEAMLVYAQALAINEQPQQGVEALQSFIAAHPGSQPVRHTLARMLLETNQPAAARQQYDQLHQNEPDNNEVLFALSLLNLQLGDLQAARSHLLALEKRDFQANRVHYYLGKLAEKEQLIDQAIEWYSKITDRDYRVDAAIRIALLQANRGETNEALALLEQTESKLDSQRIALAVTRTDILTRAGRFQLAIDAASAGLEAHPGDVDLLFSRSSAYERNGQFDLMEQDIRSILKAHPENAHALNALGYSLADRGVRLQEAHQLLTEALALEPDNPFIIDSMGWVEYRLGNLERAVSLLRRALEIMPDGEVYAHLAEALAASGEQQEARKLLNQGLTESPGNTHITAALQRLDALSGQ